MAGVKDVGDLGAAGLGVITGNQQATQNAMNAIHHNDQNLSGGNFEQNVAGLGSDVMQGIVNPVARPVVGLGIGLGENLSNALTGNTMTTQDFANEGGLMGGLTNYGTGGNKNIDLGKPRQLLGNAIQTGVNIATAGKGKVLEQGLEQVGRNVLGDNLAGRVGAKVVGSAGTGETVGAGYGAGNAVANAKNPKEAVSDVVTPAEQLGALGAAGGAVVKAPDVFNTAKEHTTPLDEVGGLNNRPVPPPEPPKNIPPEAEDNIHKNNPIVPPETGVGAPLPEPTPADLVAAHQSAAALDKSMQDPEVDWTKVQGAGQELNQTTKQLAQSFKQQEAGLRGGNIQKTAEGYIKTSEHTPFYRQFHEQNGHAPRQDDWLNYAKQYMQQKASDPLDKEGAAYRGLFKRASAENDVSNIAKADRASGYNKAKYQIPKGAPAKKFIQALYEKTHSPEYQAKTSIGRDLGETRDTLKGLKSVVSRTQKEHDALAKKNSEASEADIRAKSAELGSLKRRYSFLKDTEQRHALAYKESATALDQKYPDINLSAKKGVRLTSNQPFETAQPAEFDENGNVVPQKVKIKAAKTEEPYSLSDALGRTPSDKAYTGANLNENAFDPKAMAKLEAEQKLKEAQTPEPRQVEGDRAILDGIKRGDSDASIIKAYMEATGADEAAARKAYGVMEDETYVDKAGNPQNNPQYGQPAKYDIGEAAPVRGLNKVLIRSQSGIRKLITNPTISKVLLRGTAPGKLLEIKTDLAQHAWDKLSSEDQALADKLRGHSIEDVASQAKYPEAFKDYAARIKDIQDYIHAVRPNAEPFAEGAAYRQNYGAGFHLTNDAGEATALGPTNELEPNWMKGRHFNDYADIEQASGLKRSTENFHEDVQKDVSSADKYLSQHGVYNGLKEAFGAKAVSADLNGQKHAYGMVGLKDFADADGKPVVYARENLAKRINSRKIYNYNEGARGEILRRYDALNALMKTAKLSLGGFHNINVGLSETALNAKALPDVVHAWASDPFYRNALDDWMKNGTMEKAIHGGVTLNAGPEFDANIVAKLPGIKQLHDALFQRQIPFSKMADFEKYTQGMDLSHDYDQIRGVARGVNNIYGGINRLTDGISPENLKLLGRTILAVDYNEGQFRTLMSAISKGGKEGEMARRMIGGRMAILAAPGTLQGIVTGQIGKNPEEWAKFIAKQLVDPGIQTNWKTAGGTPKRISLLATVTNKVYRAIAPAFNPNNPDKTSGLKHELIGNEAAGLSFIQQEINNKDYYGNPLHGHGKNIAEDIGAAVDAASPIPAGPAARALEGTRFGKNEVVKTLAGGQSAISPAEAAVDISGVGRGQANPDDPRMQLMNNRQLLVESLKGNEQAQAGVYAVHPSWDSDLTKQQQADIYNNPHYEGNKWAALQNPTVFATLKKQNDFAVKHGQPGDPLFALSPKDQQTVLSYKELTAVDPGSDSNDRAAVIFADNKDMIQKYEQDVSAYAQKEQQLYQQSGGLQGDAANSPTITPGGVPYPSILQSADNQKIMDGYTQLLDKNADSATKQQYIADHPEVQQMFDAAFNYGNAKAKALGLPLEKPYPKADPALEAWITNYVKADKAGRASMRNADMNSFKGMQNYMASVDEYLLARTAGQAKYVGHDFSQGNLKEIFNLGKYDIMPTKNADGTTTYSVDPEGAFAAGGGSGSKGYRKFSRSSKSSAAYNRLKASQQLHEGKTGLSMVRKDMGRKITLHTNSRPVRGFGLKGQPHQPKYVTIASAKTSMPKNKSVKILSEKPG